MNTDVVGYKFDGGDLWCPRCLIRDMVADGTLSPGALTMDPELVLRQHADANAISDLERQDPDHFPVPILRNQSSDGYGECCECGEEL